MTTMTSPSVDDETYTMLQEIMADEFGELLGFFRADTLTALDNLQQCLDAEDSAQVGAICHKLKSSGKLIGAFQLAELSSSLEGYKDDHDHQRAAGNLGDLRAEYSKVVAWLDAQPLAA
ncbi:MAG: Hpt domain-containing protein [Thiothrix sp.]|uniref:Hpt domain-containing protein n=1 Tax=Thiothrix sp. TaxID=1032 RepID=UPI00261CFB1A|nr:Hpt domain-containing protein [Thiothrix sp.]MDD5395036.1 Hpt domain-containing protein [Thiothrix sp.]